MITTQPSDYQPQTEQALQRAAAGEVRTRVGERLSDVYQAQQYLQMHAEKPDPVVTSTDQAVVTEANPPVAQHIVSAVSEVAPVTVEAAATPDAQLDPTNVEAIRAHVAVLADNSPTAQSERDKYGIFS